VRQGLDTHISKLIVDCSFGLIKEFGSIEYYQLAQRRS